MKRKIHLPDIVGKHYKEFWHFKGRYRVCKGSRASKKSKTAALWFIYNLMKHPESNLLVCRKEFNTLKNSCFTELKWAINRLGVKYFWEVKQSPLEMTYKPTGQKIYFRGLDDPEKITSIAVEVGTLCWGWLEEAYQVQDEADFDMLDECLRGYLPEGLFYQWTFTFNPWNEHSWIKKRFFDIGEGETVIETLDKGIVKQFYDDEIGEAIQTLAITTNFLMNEFIDNQTLATFKQMKIRNPRHYKVAGLGDWGVVEGNIFDMFTEENTYNRDFVKTGMRYIAIDYGTVNPMVFLDIWDEGEAVYVAKEFYYDSRKTGKQKTDSEYATELKKFLGDMSNNNYPVYVVIDPSAASFKLEVRKLGIRVKDADNGVLDGIRHLSNLFEMKKVFVHEDCKNTIAELESYAWDEKAAKVGREQPIKDNDHTCDALRYFAKTIINPRRWRYGPE